MGEMNVRSIPSIYNPNNTYEKTPIVLWGTGSVALKVIQSCRTIDNYKILGVIDNDSVKWGKKAFGSIVYSPDILDELDFEYLIILSNYYDEIFSQIKHDFPDVSDKVKDKYYLFQKSIECRYEGTKDSEIKEILSYIEKKGLNVFNYSFVEKYKDISIQVDFDNDNGLFFVVHNGKKMYMSRKFNSYKSVKDYYIGLMIEQDISSPHRYTDEDFGVEYGDVVIDAGAAEGIFTMEVIEKVSKVYLLEPEIDWVEALGYTFDQYKDKVKIIQGYASAYDEGIFFKIDSIIDEKVNFIKMDIEGDERIALEGAERIIEKSDDLKLAICTYHNDSDEELISSFFSKHYIEYEFTKGYMWFPYHVSKKYISTKLNRGIIRGKKMS